MDTSDLAIRMKSYEDVNKTRFIRHLPLIIRVDGNSFHNFTKGLDRPFDEILHNTMLKTMVSLCEHIPCAVLGYTQSDEITIVVADYSQISEPWFGGVKRKIESITASMATKYFNLHFSELVYEKKEYSEDFTRYMKYMPKIGNAMFDSRAFNLPIFEVTNNLIWRQNDAIRNSIQMVGRANFPHGSLQNKNRAQIVEMLKTEKKIDLDKLPTEYKQGCCCIKIPRVFNEGTPEEFTRNKWEIDYNIPLFTQNRDYIDKLVKYPEED